MKLVYSKNGVVKRAKLHIEKNGTFNVIIDTKSKEFDYFMAFGNDVYIFIYENENSDIFDRVLLIPESKKDINILHRHSLEQRDKDELLIVFRPNSSIREVIIGKSVNEKFFTDYEDSWRIVNN